jgi:YidC/Oxa1 family membrane protein insertase
MRPGTEVVVVHRLDMPLLGKPRQVITDILDADRNVPLFHDDITVAVSTPRDRARVVKLKPKGDPVVHKYVLYNGPVKVAQLNQLTLHHEVDGVPAGGPAVDPALVTFYHDDLHLDTLTDYRAPGPVSEWLKWTPWTSIIIWCTNRLHWLLWQLHRILPVYGLCIVLLTVLVRGAMFPVSRKQALTSIRMQELAPELKKLHEKYKGDRQAMGTAQMELYRKHGVNPFGSCWLILLQMPVFLGLYFALQESIHFRLAPFLWIENLAAPDMLIRWGESIPWISLPRDYGGWLYLGPYFNLLPVIAVILMLMQQKLTMPPPTDEQTAMQMKMMKYMMIFMGLMFYKIASGLCIYFIASSLWGFAERKLLPRRKMIGPDGTEQPVPPSLWQKMRQRLRTARAGSSRTPLAGAITPRPDGNVVVRGAGPAGEPQASPPRGKKKHTRERRKGERRPEGGSAALSSADGPVRRVRGWWTEARDKMRHWWTELLKQAEKK